MAKELQGVRGTDRQMVRETGGVWLWSSSQKETEAYKFWCPLLPTLPTVRSQRPFWGPCTSSLVIEPECQPLPTPNGWWAYWTIPASKGRQLATDQTRDSGSESTCMEACTDMGPPDTTKEWMKVDCGIGTITLNSLNQHLMECIYTGTKTICLCCHQWLAADEACSYDLLLTSHVCMLGKAAGVFHTGYM